MSNQDKTFGSFDKLKFIVRPMVLYCLKHSIRLQELIECLKAVFITTAQQLLNDSNIEQTYSKISVMTGIHRADIKRLEQGGKAPSTASSNISKVVGTWFYDSKFSISAGVPRALEITGKNSEFAELVKKVSLDLNPYTVLFELERSGVAKRQDNKLILNTGVYIPRGDEREGFIMLARDMEDLMIAVEENIESKKRIPNLHIQTEYDRVPECFLPTIQEWILKHGEKYHEELRDFLSQYDADTNPQLEQSEKYVDIAVTTFSRAKV